MNVESGERRRCSQAVAGTGPWHPTSAPAQAQQGSAPIADMHSHFGLIQRAIASTGPGTEMRGRHVAALVWKIVDEGPRLHSSPRGIDLVGTREREQESQISKTPPVFSRRALDHLGGKLPGLPDVGSILN